MDEQRKTPYVIAELGENIFSGSIGPRARLSLMVAAAAGAGAGAVKVQLYTAGHFPESEWAKKRETQFPRDALLEEFISLAHTYDMDAGASVFDIADVDLASFDVDFLKIACREELNVPLLFAAMGTGRPIYRSVDVRSWPRWPNTTRPWTGGPVTTLLCIPEYPVITPYDPSKLPTMNNPWGWSSHTDHWVDCVEAVRLGATVIEKHLCLDKSDREGRWSLTPDEFRQMVVELKGEPK